METRYVICFHDEEGKSMCDFEEYATLEEAKKRFQELIKNPFEIDEYCNLFAKGKAYSVTIYKDTVIDGKTESELLLDETL